MVWRKETERGKKRQGVVSLRGNRERKGRKKKGGKRKRGGATECSKGTGRVV